MLFPLVVELGLLGMYHAGTGFPSDPESGVVKYEVYQSWTDDTFYTEETDYCLILADGSHYIKVRAQNRAGLWSDWSPELWVYIDTVSPQSSVDLISPYWQNAEMVPFTITATALDELSGIENVVLRYRYSPDNSAWGLWEEFAVDYEEPWSWEFDAPDGDGYYEFYTVAVDRAGNAEVVPEVADARCGIDTLPPKSSVNPIKPYWQWFPPIEVAASAMDNEDGFKGSGVAGVELFYRHSLDNETWGDWTAFSTDNEGPYRWSFNIPAGHGFYEFYSIACDEAGNIEEPPAEADARCATLIPATIDIDPDTLNLKSQGRWITAYIELPDGLDVAKINVGTVALEGDVFLEGILSAERCPTEIGDHDNDGIPDLMVKFDRAAVQDLVSVGEVELTIIGKWGLVPFRGSDTIWVIEPDKGPQDRGNNPEVPLGQSEEHDKGKCPPQTLPGKSTLDQSQGNHGKGNSGGNRGEGQRKLKEG